MTHQDLYELLTGKQYTIAELYKSTASGDGNMLLSVRDGINLLNWKAAQVPGMIVFSHFESYEATRDPNAEATSMILCVRAPEDQRERFDRQAAAMRAKGVPVTLLMQEEFKSPDRGNL